jgi:hypothetical protein
MRKGIWIFCVLAVIVCLLLLFKVEQPNKIVVSAQNEALTNIVGQVRQTVSTNQNLSSPMAGRLSVSNAVAALTALGTSNVVDPRILEAWQTPIVFYGKVIDANSNAVASVNIHFRWSEKPTEDGMRTSDTKTDSEGLFSLQGVVGRSLTVSFSKDGYYSSHNGQRTFLYALGADIYSPDQLNPTIFTLYQKGNAEALISLKQNYRIPRDGTPVAIDLVTGKTVTGDTSDFIVQCWTDDQGKRSGQKYDWRCLVTIPNGGIVLTDSEFPFLAPETGYVSTNLIAIGAEQQGWTSEISEKFYYQLSDGRYGRMKFSMIAGGDNCFMIDSVLNPSGSRNLEPQ